MSIHCFCYWCSTVVKGKAQPLFCFQLYHLVYWENTYTDCSWRSILARRKSTTSVLCCQLYHVIYRENASTQFLLLVIHIGRRKHTNTEPQCCCQLRRPGFRKKKSNYVYQPTRHDCLTVSVNPSIKTPKERCSQNESVFSYSHLSSCRVTKFGLVRMGTLGSPCMY